MKVCCRMRVYQFHPSNNFAVVSVRGRAFFAAVALSMILAIWPAWGAAQELSEVVQWTDSLTLEERMEGPDGVYTVWPQASIDPDGGVIVVDEQEFQVRLYDRAGRLKNHFGRRGQGPGEFQRPTRALRLSSGQILVPDVLGTIARFDESGAFVDRSPRLFSRIYEIHELPVENEILVVGMKRRKENRRAPGSYPLLHRYNLETGEITKSFFPHPIPLGSYSNVLFGIGRIAVADVFGDRIAVAFAPLDKLYFFRVDGAPVDSVAVPFEHFRQLQDPGRRTLSSQEIWDYSTTYSRINRVYWLDTRLILIQYWDLIQREPWTTRANLAATTPKGKLLFDVDDTPRLLTVDPETQELFFSDPEYEVENRWKVGRLRRSALP